LFPDLVQGIPWAEFGRIATEARLTMDRVPSMCHPPTSFCSLLVNCFCTWKTQWDGAWISLRLILLADQVAGMPRRVLVGPMLDNSGRIGVTNGDHEIQILQLSSTLTTPTLHSLVPLYSRSYDRRKYPHWHNTTQMFKCGR